MIVRKLKDEEVWAKVDRSIGELLQWNARRADTMVTVSQWGDSKERKCPILEVIFAESKLIHLEIRCAI